MNSYKREFPRTRHRSLLIVEGAHEKNKLFKTLFQCFPELGVSIDDIIIYGTNIYILHEQICKEYGQNWYEKNDDIDLAYLVSRNLGYSPPLRKDSFTNIFLIFDYERQDCRFSKQKIKNMQKYFSDVTNVGQLYINYPMVESYLHLTSLPDNGYKHLKVSTCGLCGDSYKNLVVSKSCLENIFNLPASLSHKLQSDYKIFDNQSHKECIEELLHYPMSSKQLENVLSVYIDAEHLSQAVHHINSVLDSYYSKHICGTSCSCITHLRNIISVIIKHNIYKANFILNNNYDIDDDDLKNCFYQLDLCNLLSEQNKCSCDTICDYIWVLNTCVFMIPEYNFNLIR